MPELPEVETVRKTLKNFIIGKTIRDIDIYYNKIIRNQTDDEFKDKLVDNTIRDIKRYGKYLIFVLDNYALISHLRMEGKYFLKQLDEKKEKHEHIIFYFSDGTTLRYNDTRKFGTMDIVEIKDIYTNSPITKQGYEPFNPLLTGKYLQNALKNKRVAIKSALLDQTIISGLGNIYVDEVLFLSNIHPTTAANALKLSKYKEIITNSITVLNKAIDLGGTTIRSYTSSLGITGRFQNELLVHTLEDEECKVCKDTIKKMKVNGRGTYYCPTCQK